MLYKNVASQKLAVFGYTASTGAAKTGDAAQITAYISKDFAAGAATDDTNPTELDATNMPGWYVFTLTQAETNAEVIVLAAKSSTSGVLLEQIQVLTQDAAISSRSSQASLDTVDGIVDDILVDTGTTLDALIKDVPTVAEFEARTLDSAATARLDALLDATPTGAVVDDNDPDPTTTAFETNLSEATDDHYNGAFVVFTSGALLGQSRKISDYDGATKVVTVATAFTEAPAGADTFIILGRSE